MINEFLKEVRHGYELMIVKNEFNHWMVTRWLFFFGLIAVLAIAIPIVYLLEQMER